MRRFSLSITMALAVVLAVAVPIDAQSVHYYVLDGFGGVHASGGAPALSPSTPYFGFDVAQDLAFLPLGAPGAHGGGLLVLDRFGGVHAGGVISAAAANPRPPYFGFDIARAIALRNVPPRVAGMVSTSFTTLTNASSSYTAALSATIHAPDGGFLLVNGSASALCSFDVAGNGSIGVALAVNTTSPGVSAPVRNIGFTDCTDGGPGLGVPIESVALTQLFSVGAGQHTVHLLARKISGTQSVSLSNKGLTVLFVDQNSVGSS